MDSYMSTTTRGHLTSDYSDGHWEGDVTNGVTNDVTNGAWKDIELPGGDYQWKQAVQGRPIDLDLLWKVLEKHKEQMEEKETTGTHMNNTWELVIVQGVLLTILVLISLSWAFCCKSKCIKREVSSPSVLEALRKVSSSSCKVSDLPPSYSNMDLHTLGISVNDYLHPPPEYLHLFADNLQYLDLEQGHNRLAKLSFCNEDGSVPRMARLSVASCENCSSESPVVVPVRSERSSMSSSSSASSRRQSRNSKVSFSDEVECSNGSIRRLSANSLIGTGARPVYSRGSSSSSVSSRGSSSGYSSQRKTGSNNKDALVDTLDIELQEKLATIEYENEPNKETVTAELQAERAAKTCDIVLFDK